MAGLIERVREGKLLPGELVWCCTPSRRQPGMALFRSCSTRSSLLQVLWWPVSADSEENAVKSGKERQGLKKESTKVGCWERAMSKHYLSCNNSDGGRTDLLLCQFWVSGNISSIPYL